MAEFLFDFLQIPIPDFLFGLGFLLLSLYYAITNPCFPIHWKQRDTNHCQCRAKRRRKGGTFEGRRICQKEAEEGRKLLSILKRISLGQHPDTTSFRQLLCPDPLCEVCNRTTAEVSHLLYMASLEDAAPSPSPLTSTASVTELSSPLFSAASTMSIEEPIPARLPEPCPPSPSILSPNQVTPLVDLFLPSPLSDSLPTEPIPPSDSRFPVGLFPPQMHAFPTPSPQHTQASDPVLQPGGAMSLVGSPAGLSNYVPAVRDTGCSSLAISQCSWWKAHNNNMLLPGLTHYNFQREKVSLHLSDSYFWNNTSHVEAHHVCFLGLNIQELLQRQIKNRTTFQILEKQEKEHEPFLQQKWSKYQLTSSWNSMQPLDDELDTTDSQPGWDVKGKPEHLGICQQLVYLKTLGRNLEQKYSQIFWGLPSLHSESIVATLLVSRNCSSLEPHFILFNGIYNVPVAQMQGQESLQLSHSHTLHLTNVQPQPLLQMKPQTHTLPPSQVHSQAHVKSPLPILPLSSSSQTKDCGSPCHRVQNRADCHILNENQHLEWHVLQKHQESLWGLVPEFQKCQEAFCPPAPKLPLVRRPPQAYVPVTIFPGHFHISSHPPENQELHEPEKLIPSWNLQSYHNLGSLAPVKSQCKSTEMSQHSCRHVHSQPSELQGHSSKDLGKREVSLSGSFYENFPTKVQLRMDSAKNLGHILGKCPLDNPLVVSEGHVRNDPSAESKKNSDWVCPSRDDAGNEFRYVTRKILDVNQMRNILRLHVSRKSWQITAGRIPISVCHSWLVDDSELSPPPRGSHTHTENRKMAPVVCRVQCQITNLELSFLDHKTQQVLEAHIIRFRVSQKWGLPLKVLESIKFYMLREAKTWPLPQCDFLSSSTHISGVDSKSEVFRPLRVGSKASRSSKVEITNSPFMMDHSLPAMSSVAIKGQSTLRQSCCDAYHEVTENIQTTEDNRRTCVSCTCSITDKVSRKDTEQVNSAFIIDHSLLDTLPVAVEGQRTLRQSCCGASHEVTENIQTTEDGRQTCVSCTRSITDKVSQNNTEQVNWAFKIDRSLPDTSSVAIKGQSTLRQPCCNTSHGITENIQTTEDDRQTCVSCTRSITDKVSQNNTEQVNWAFKIDRSLPDTSSVAIKGQSTLRQSCCNTFHEVTENIQTTEDDRQTCVSCTRSVMDKVSQNNIEQVSSAFIIDRSLPDTSSVAIKGQSTLRQSCCDTSHGIKENIQTTEDDRQTRVSCTCSITDKMSQDDTELENRSSSEQSTRQGGDGHEWRDERVSSSHHVEVLRDKRMVGKNYEHFSTSFVCRQIFKAHELRALQSQVSSISTPSKLESSHTTNESVSKAEITTAHPPRIPEDPPREPMFKLESGSQSQCPSSSPSDTSPLDSSASDSSLTHSRSGSSGDLVAFQSLHVDLDDTGMSTEQQEPWEPKPLVWEYQAKNFPPVEMRASPPRCQRGNCRNCRNKDSGLEAPGAARKSHPPAKDRNLEEASKSLPQKMQGSSESYFRRKIKQLFQWLDCRKKSTAQQSPMKDKALFMSCGPPEAHELMAALGKILEEKMAHTQEGMALKLNQQKEELLVESRYEQPSMCGAASGSQQEEGPSLCSCNHAAVSLGPNCLTSTNQVRADARPPKKTVSFKDNILFQSHPPSPPSRMPRFRPASPALNYARCLWLPSHLLKALGSET